MTERSPGYSQIHSRISEFTRLLLIVLPLAICGNIVYLLVVAEADLIRNLIGFNGWYMALAVFLALLPWPAQSFRIFIWGRLLRRRIAYGQCFRTVLASDLGAALSPTILGGGYVTLGFLIGYGFTAAEATLVTFLGTLVDALFFAGAIPLSIYLSRAWENPYVDNALRTLLSSWPLAVTVACLLVVALLIIRRLNSPSRKSDSVITTGQKPGLLSKMIARIVRFREDFGNAARFVLRRGKRAFAAAVLVAGLGWCGRYGAVSALAFGLGYEVDPVLFFLLQWVVFTTMTMVPTPGAIGGAEVSFSLVYRGLIPANVIPLLMSAWRFVTFYLTVGLGALLLAALGNMPSGAEAEHIRPVSLERTPI